MRETRHVEIKTGNANVAAGAGTQTDHVNTDNNDHGLKKWLQNGRKRSHSEDEIGEEQKGQNSGESIMEKSKIKKLEEDAKAQTSSKVREIVKREFASSLKAKEEEVEELDDRLLQVRKALQLVRYGSVVNYYSNSVVKQTRSNPENVSIHPAVRKVLAGKRPLAEETAKSDVATVPLSVKKIKTEEPEEVLQKEPTILPGYVPPKPSQSAPVVLDPRNVKHKTKRRFIIGNVSKWIQCDQREDLSTHKWMMYVRGDKDNPDVSDVVSKVRFLIHPSYSPHDLVEVKTSPYHLTRRGWGEFPARVQIHFKNEKVDKPIDVIHQLKLDRTYTGLQTLGGETVVDVWLHDRDSAVDPLSLTSGEAAGMKTKALIDTLEDTPEGLVIPHKEENVIDSKDFLSTLQVPIKEEVFANNLPERKEEISPNGKRTTYIKCTDKSGEEYYLPITIMPNNQKKQLENTNGTIKPIKKNPLVITRRNNGKIRLLKSSSPSVMQKGETLNIVNSSSLSSKKPLSVVRAMGTRSVPGSPDRSSSKYLTGGESGKSNGNVSLLKTTKSLPPVPAGMSLLKRNSASLNAHHQNGGSGVVKQAIVNTDALTELEKSVPEVSLSTWDKILGRNREDHQSDIENRLLKKGTSFLKAYTAHCQLLSEKLFKLSALDFLSADTCIMYLTRYFPLITPLAHDSSYRVLHPHAASSLKEFQYWNIGKQLSAEWHRAKVIHRLIMHNTGLSSALKPTKYIFKLLREHGYSLLPGDSDYELENGGKEEMCYSNKFEPLEEALIRTVDQKISKDRRDCESLNYIDILRVDEEQQKQQQPKRWKEQMETSSRTDNNSHEHDGPKVCLLLPEDNMDAFKFVSDSARKLGIKFNQQEIAPKVFYPAVEKVIFRAMKNFAESLIRKSYKEAFHKNDGRSPSRVGTSDVISAIEKNEDFSVLSNRGLGKALKTEKMDDE